MKNGPDLYHNEKTAIETGGQVAGAYLDSIGKTDLATLTGAEWAEFLARAFKATTDALRQQATDDIPF